MLSSGSESDTARRAAVASESDTARRPVVSAAKVWPAVLTLFLLAPLVGEVLSGSTPPANYFTSPLQLVFETLLYGSGAVLMRELVRRRGLGWWRIILLGAAYGIFEEGLVVTSWFNPFWPDLGRHPNFGRALGIAWPWAVGLTAYHAVVSITIPIVLTEVFFPRVASAPWLNRRGIRLFQSILGFVWVAGFIGFGVAAPTVASGGAYSHPPVSYLLAIALAAVFLSLGLAPSRGQEKHLDPSPAPGMWTLRLFALMVTAAFFFVHFGQQSLIRSPVVEVAVVLGILLVAGVRVNTWAHRAGWGERHRLALASGVVLFFILLSPILALNPQPGKATWSMPYAAPVWAAFLVVLAVRAKRNEQHNKPVLPVYGGSEDGK